jgi:hypothetical protein
MTIMTGRTIEEARYSKLGPRVVEALKARFFDAYYCDDEAAAVERVFSLMPAGVTVSWGGSVTFDDVVGLSRMAAERGYKVIDRDAAANKDEREARQHEALSCDTFLCGVNAISEDGQLVQVDGMGNRVAAMIYGPRQVIIIAGMNKVAATLDGAMLRARTIAAPLNTQRFNGLKTPCAQTGACADCRSPDCICTYIVTTRQSKPAGRIKLVLVGKSLGL